MINGYFVVDRTPEEMRCILGSGCPVIYEVTPLHMRCISGMACPAIYKENKDNYLIIGKVVDVKEFDLEKKVGEGEALISVPKRLIDGMKRK